jgi:hypothetical protein
MARRPPESCDWLERGRPVDCVMVSVYVFIFRDSVDKAWRKVSFDLTDGKIIGVMEGRPPIELLLSEILAWAWLSEVVSHRRVL